MTSVSERLKMLDGALTPGPWAAAYWPLPEPTHWIGQRDEDIFSSRMKGQVTGAVAEGDARGLSALRNALPLIADQTKAAEDVLHEYHLWAEDANDGEFAIWSREEFMAAFHRLQIAFNALNETLGEGSLEEETKQAHDALINQFFPEEEKE